MEQISVAKATAISLGAIIGAGIFVLSGSAIALAGSLAILAFILVGISQITLGIEFGLLGQLMPSAKGSSYSYVYEAFGSELAFITGSLLFMSYATGVSAISLGFGAYLANLLNISQNYAISFAILLILILTILNIKGLKEVASVDFWLVLIKLSILIGFSLFAIYMSFHIPNINEHFVNNANQDSITSIFLAAVAIVFAYSGYQSVSTITNRVKGGSKGAAKAIIYSIIISLVVYLLVVIGLLLLAPASAYSISGNPLDTALRYSNAPKIIEYIVDIGALIATTSATLASILVSSRVLYDMSRDYLLPKQIRVYDKKKDAPTNAIIVTAFVGIITLFSGNIFIIAAISNFGLLLSYLMASFALMHFRRLKKIDIPFYPYLPLIAIISVFVFLIGMPKEALLFGVYSILILLIVYYALREIKNKKVIRIKLFS